MEESDFPISLLSNDHQWKAPVATGALLCTKGSGYLGTKWYWEACDDAANKKVAVTPDGTKYRCKNNRWTKQ